MVGSGRGEPEVWWTRPVIVWHVYPRQGKDHEEQSDFGWGAVGVAHDAQCIIELIEPFLDSRSMKEPVRRHRKVEIPLYQALSIVSGQHHTE